MCLVNNRVSFQKAIQLALAFRCQRHISVRNLRYTIQRPILKSNIRLGLTFLITYLFMKSKVIFKILRSTEALHAVERIDAVDNHERLNLKSQWLTANV